MKNIFLFIIGVVIAITFTNCKKTNSFKVSISGKVVESNHQTAISNATLVLSASMISSGTYNSNYNEIANTTTDGSGNYTFNASIDGKPVGLRVAVVKSGYFTNSFDLSPTLFENGNTYTQDFNLFTESFIKLQVNNVSPNDSSDRITYYYTLSPSLHCSQCCSDNQITGYGQYYHASSVCKTYGNQWTKIVWTVIKYGNMNFHADSIYIAPSDTAQYTINY